MGRMPSEADLGMVLPNSPDVPRPPRDLIGPAITQAGNQITAVEDARYALQKGIALKQKNENDALDTARANADWNKRNLAETEKADLTVQPDYSKWDKTYEGDAEKGRQQSAQLIRDPKRREMFLAQTGADVPATAAKVRGKAQQLDGDKRLAEGLSSIDDNLAAAVREEDPKARNIIISRAQTDIDNMVHAGIMMPAQAVEARKNFSTKYATLKFKADMDVAPDKAAAWLDGRDGGSYYVKLRRKENASGDPNAGPGTSSARGYYQFTESTWRAVRKAHPELNLSPDGRGTAEEDLAIRAFTGDNARVLKENGFPANEATLYLAHFMGVGGAVKALRSNQSTSAAELFPDAAKANRSVFYRRDGTPRTVGEMIAVQTRTFDDKFIPGNDASKPEPPPDYYKLIPPEQAVAGKAAIQDYITKRDDINLVQDVADSITKQSGGDRTAAYAAADDIPDGTQRKSVKTLLDAEFKRQDETAKDNEKATYETSFGAVTKALEGGDVKGAYSAIDPALPPTKIAELKKLITDGQVVHDDPGTEQMLTSLWMKDEQKFAGTDLTGYYGKLSIATIDKFKARQEAIKTKEANSSPEDKMLTATKADVDQSINRYMDQIGVVDTGANSTPDSIRYANTIRSIAMKETETLIAKMGRKPGVTEVDDMMKGIFKVYPKAGGSWFGWGTKNIELDDAVKEYENRGLDIDAAAAALKRAGKPINAESFYYLLDLADKAGTKQ